MKTRQAIQTTAAGIGASLVFSATFLAVPAVGGWHGTAYAYPSNMCQYEDGNTDGRRLCQWQDPDTGRWYSVTSENYQ